MRVVPVSIADSRFVCEKDQRSCLEILFDTYNSGHEVPLNTDSLGRYPPVISVGIGDRNIVDIAGVLRRIRTTAMLLAMISHSARISRLPHGKLSTLIFYSIG